MLIYFDMVNNMFCNVVSLYVNFDISLFYLKNMPTYSGKFCSGASCENFCVSGDFWFKDLIHLLA